MVSENDWFASGSVASSETEVKLYGRCSPCGGGVGFEISLSGSEDAWTL